jgi:excisionase family DNA binding protein
MDTTHPPEKRLLTVAEVAAYLSIANQTIRNAVSRGNFPIKEKRIGRSVRFDVKDVEAYVDGL